jgi:CheY-like chemotaxis protein
MISTILIVDDDSAALKLLKDILTANGYVVRSFNNGELALKSVMAQAPELIVLDIRMPVMNGFEVNRQLTHI